MIRAAAKVMSGSRHAVISHPVYPVASAAAGLMRGPDSGNRSARPAGRSSLPGAKPAYPQVGTTWAAHASTEGGYTMRAWIVAFLQVIIFLAFCFTVAAF